MKKTIKKLSLVLILALFLSLSMFMFVACDDYEEMAQDFIVSWNVSANDSLEVIAGVVGRETISNGDYVERGSNVRFMWSGAESQRVEIRNGATLFHSHAGDGQWDMRNVTGNITVTFQTAENSFDVISHQEAWHKINYGENVVIVDTRSHSEWIYSRVPNSVLLPYDNYVEFYAPILLPDRSATILVYCRTGRRSLVVSDILVELGYVNVFEFGGIEEWRGYNPRHPSPPPADSDYRLPWPFALVQGCPDCGYFPSRCCPVYEGELCECPVAPVGQVRINLSIVNELPGWLLQSNAVTFQIRNQNNDIVRFNRVSHWVY
ncbi:MAG: rhodanese-like domain-containing protein, partial [Firmicutes bacterium]|nr:rhodanese-like domain-containing protein [Bacillota bacterium]